MDIILIIAGAICLIIGIIGSFLPVLPGPPLAYVGMLLLHFTDRVQFSVHQLVWWLILVGLTLLADYLLPVFGVKKWKGSNWGNFGCVVGTIIGIFIFPPWGIVVGPFLGATLGELIFAGRKFSEALKAGFGAFMGFMLGLVFKLAVCGWFAFCFVKALVT